MHQTASERAQSNRSHMGGGELRRLSVYADSVRVDLVLPAMVPIESLMPAIVDILARRGGYPAGPLPLRPQLSRPGNSALDPLKTLAALGIRDGSTLMLTSSSAELAAPRVDDVAEALSVSVAATARPWTSRATGIAGAFVASCLAGAAAVALIRTALDANDSRRTACAGLAAAVSLLALVAATIAGRVFRHCSAGLTLGLLASGFAAIAGLLAVPGGPGAPNGLLSGAAAAASAAVMCVIGCFPVVFTALACVATIGVAAALVGVIIGPPLQSIASATTAVSLLLVELAAPMSIMLAGLAPQVPSGPAVSDELLNTRAVRASAWLTSIIVGFSTTAALGAIGAMVGLYSTGGSRAVGISFAAITGGVLLLRARSHSAMPRSLPLVVSGTVTVSIALVVAAAAYPPRTPYIAAASTLLASAALCLNFMNHWLTVSPLGRRSVELFEYLALASVVPLTFWICGLYSATRGLNLP